MICPCFTTKNLWMLIYLEKVVFAGVIKFKVSKWDDLGLSGWPLNLITSVLVTKDTWKKACDYRDRDWNDAATSQATGASRNWKRKGEFSQELFEGVKFCWHLDFRLLVSKLWDNKFFSVTLSHHICGSLLWLSQESNTHIIKAETNKLQKTNDPFYWFFMKKTRHWKCSFLLLSMERKTLISLSLTSASKM